MSEVFPTEEMLRAQRLMADMPDQIQNFFNSDVRKLFATIDHWKQRAEQAHNEGKNAALKEIARWLGHDTATFGSVRKWIDELRLRAEQAEADRKVLGAWIRGQRCSMNPCGGVRNATAEVQAALGRAGS